MDVPCSALGDNIGVSIAVFFAFVVLLGVANGLGPSVFLKYRDLSDPCLSAGNDPEPEQSQSDKFYRADLYPADVDELSSPHPGMADTA